MIKENNITKEKIETIEKRLEQRYNSFVNETNEKSFFQGLIDYLFYVRETPLLSNSAEFYYKIDREISEKRLHKIEKVVREEIDEAQKFIFNYIAKNKIKSEELSELIKEYELAVNNKISSNYSKETLLNDALWDIVRLLHKEGHKEITERYLKVDSDGNIIEDYTIPSHSKYLNEKKDIEELKELKFWGAWDRLLLTFISSIQKREELEKEKKKNNYLNMLGLGACINELRDILNENNADRRYHFKLNDYKGYTNIVHHKLLGIIDRIKEKSIMEYKDRVITEEGEDSSSPKLPENTRWEDITIKFINSQDVIIKAKEKGWETNYEIMGFQDKKKKMPNRQWELLEMLSKKNGEMSWENNKDLSKKDIDAIKKRKQNLAEGLKKYFHIKDNPFDNYKKEKAYKIKINLIPQDLDEENDNKDVYGITDAINEEANLHNYDGKARENFSQNDE